MTAPLSPLKHLVIAGITTVALGMTTACDAYAQGSSLSPRLVLPRHNTNSLPIVKKSAPAMLTGNEATLVVKARDPFTPTGMKVKKGDTLMIAAETLTKNKVSICGIDGNRDSHRYGRARNSTQRGFYNAVMLVVTRTNRGDFASDNVAGGEEICKLPKTGQGDERYHIVQRDGWVAFDMNNRYPPANDPTQFLIKLHKAKF